MTIKTTMSLPDEIYAQAERAVAEGRATSISAYFAELARREGEREALADLIASWDAEDGATRAESKRARAAVDAAWKRANAFFAKRRKRAA